MAVAFLGAQNSTLIVPPLLVSIAADMDTSVPIAAQLVTASFAAWAVSVVMCGPLSDSFGRRPMALIGLSLLTASTLGAAFAPNLETLLALRVVTGLGGGMIPPNGVAAVSEVISPDRRAQAVGGLMAVNIFSSSIIVPVAALLADSIGWRVTFLAMGCLLTLALVLNWIWFPRGSRARVRDFSFVSRFRALLSLGFFRAAIFVGVTHRMAYWAIISYLAAFLVQVHGLTVGAVAIPLACAAAGQIVGSYSAGYVAKRKDRSTLLSATIILGGFCGLVIFALPVGVWVSVALASVGTGLLSVAFPTLVAVSTEYSGPSRATGIGLLGLGNQSGGAFGAAIAGALLASVGFAGIGYLCLVAAAAGAAVAVMFNRMAPLDERQLA